MRSRAIRKIPKAECMLDDAGEKPPDSMSLISTIIENPDQGYGDCNENNELNCLKRVAINMSRF